MSRHVALIILDGFGYRANSQYNAIAHAQAPTWKKIWQECPHLLIEGSGQSVGLPEKQMGNSEVGHLNIGAGRVVYQELTRIDQAMTDGSFATHPLLKQAFHQLIQKKRALHVLGLLSPGGVHSHENHIIALLHLAKKANISHIYLHAFLDGRDTPPQSAMASIQKINAIPGVTFASLSGRYYAMDRDQRWERTQQVYDLLTTPTSQFSAPDAITAVQQAYRRGETDEFVQPTRICAANQPPWVMQDEDVVVFMNFRADRTRQLTQAFVGQNFNYFPRIAYPKLSYFITLTQYADTLPTKILFPPQPLNNVLGEYLANLNFKQLRIAETEKYAHVTYFFNGGREKPFKGEERLLLASPKVNTYDLEPEMAAYAITEQLISAIISQQYTLLVSNFANADMVGHTGNFAATIKAIETLDICLSKIIAVAKEHATDIFITADHGNAECMFDETTQQPHTAHTSDPVPFVYVGHQLVVNIASKGCLADVAPTILKLLKLPQPAEMTGNALMQFSQ